MKLRDLDTSIENRSHIFIPSPKIYGTSPKRFHKLQSGYRIQV